MIKTEKLIYGALNSDQKYEGSISYDDSISTPRPGILVCHAYGGHSPFDIGKSEKLAELGYFAFAISKGECPPYAWQTRIPGRGVLILSS